MTLFHPVWLVLAIPVLASLWIWKLPSRLLQALRAAVLLLLLLAMSGLAVKLPSRAGTVVVVADRSLSMPPGSEMAQKESVDLIQGAMGIKDQLGVVSFGQMSSVERSPQGGKFVGFVAEVGRDASNLAEAIETAISLIPQGTSGRILLLSDGRWTGKDPIGAASRATTRGIAIDYRPLQRASANDVAISRVDAPASVTPGESFMITGWVRSPIPQDVTFELLRGGQRLASGVRRVPSGISRLTFRDRAAEPGTHRYTLRIAGTGDDPVPENNAGKILVGIRGPRPILCVTSSGDSGLVRLLQAGGMNVKALPPASCRWSLEELSKFSSVLIENVPAEKISVSGMEHMAAWLTQTGAGLMITGGRNAYGPGGYFRSPLDPIMPVSMELRQEHRKLQLAIVVALDRSGSMAVPAGGGKTKMDLANLAAAQVLDILSAADEFGVVAVDSSPHVIAPLAPIKDKDRIREHILRIDSMGGGIFVYVALSTAARMLLSAESGTRHIILFADAADSEEPGEYRRLLEECRKANITVSVIGLGTPGDRDAQLLRDIARRGEGRCFFTNNPEELPRLFAQDTFVVARSTFLDDVTSFRLTGGLVASTGKRFGDPLPIGGYNLCYLRPAASLGAVTVDEYKAPILAWWHAGIGRVLCYTGEADGEYTGPLARWREVGNFFTSMARWTAGDSGNLPGDILVTQNVTKGICLVQLHLDPESEQPPFSGLPEVTTLRGTPGEKPSTDKAGMRWTSAHTLAVEIPLQSRETALSTVEVPGVGTVSLPPVCLPYSPEFKPEDIEKGLLTMERVALATGGTERLNLAGIWRDLPKIPRTADVGRWLLIAAAVLFLLEVLERRTGVLSVRRRPLRREVAVKDRKAKEISSRRIRAAPAQPPLAEAEVRKQAAPGVDGAPAEEDTDMADALRRARRRAMGRTKRGE